MDPTSNLTIYRPGRIFFLDEVPQLRNAQSVLLSNDISEVTPLPLRILE